MNPVVYNAYCKSGKSMQVLSEQYKTDFSSFLEVLKVDEFIHILIKKFAAQLSSQTSPAQKLFPSHLTPLTKLLKLLTSNQTEAEVQIVEQALFKQTGYIRRLFSEETWNEWKSYRTPLGRLACTFSNFASDYSDVTDRIYQLNFDTVCKANAEAEKTLQQLKESEQTLKKCKAEQFVPFNNKLREIYAKIQMRFRSLTALENRIKAVCSTKKPESLKLYDSIEINEIRNVLKELASIFESQCEILMPYGSNRADIDALKHLSAYKKAFDEKTKQLLLVHRRDKLEHNINLSKSELSAYSKVLSYCASFDFIDEEWLEEQIEEERDSLEISETKKSYSAEQLSLIQESRKEIRRKIATLREQFERAKNENHIKGSLESSNTTSKKINDLDLEDTEWIAVEEFRQKQYYLSHEGKIKFASRLEFLESIRQKKDTKELITSFSMHKEKLIENLARLTREFAEVDARLSEKNALKT